MKLTDALYCKPAPDNGKQIYYPLGALLLLCATWQPLHAGELTEFRENMPTPPLELIDLHDRTHNLADYRGRVVMVNFWASWCLPCLQEIPQLMRLSELLADRPFTLLAVNVGEKKTQLPGFTGKMDEHMVVLLDTDSTVFEDWKGFVLPSTYILDVDGDIRLEALGPVEWDDPDIVASITALMSDAVVRTTALQ